MGEVERLLPLRTISTKEITDQSIELDMKGYNRADLLSLRGVAYEIAAITDSTVTFNETPHDGWIWNTSRVDKLEAPSTNLVKTYNLAKISNLKVGPSPKDWIDKLESSGMRSINNLTDITNLIMLEYGQPLHAFDAKTVASEQIIVRTAKAGEKLVTLDSRERELEENDLVITDSDKILGIAGVMGGKNSEITDQTQTILLEAAIFDPILIRQTASRLSLNSEASKRFVHGLSEERLLQALDSAIKMYQQIGGELRAIQVTDKTDSKIAIPLTVSKTNQLIGIELKKDQIDNFLKKLHIIASDPGKFTAPYWRLDLKIEEDLIEEVARMYGYENIPATPLPNLDPQTADQSLFELINKLKEQLVEIGLTEVETYSFFSTDVLKSIDLNGDKRQNLVKVANPISAETEYLRDSIWPNLAEVVSKNYRQGFSDIAIFEIGRVFYLPAESSQPPEESYRLSLSLMNNTDNPIEELINILEKLDLGITIDGPSQKDMPEFHPVRHRRLLFNDQPIGGIAEVHPRVINGLGIDKRVAVTEFSLKAIL